MAIKLHKCYCSLKCKKMVKGHKNYASGHHPFNTCKGKREKRRELSKRFGWVCWYCGFPLKKDKGVADHVVPRSLGGSDSLWNLALACNMCNRAKYTMPLVRFLEWLEYVKSSRSYSRVHVYDYYHAGDK